MTYGLSDDILAPPWHRIPSSHACNMGKAWVR